MSKQKMIYTSDPYLAPHKYAIEARKRRVLSVKKLIAGENATLSSAINNHLYFCLHMENGEWVFREWAPNASAIYLTGDFNGWSRSEEFKLHPVGDGNWELRLPHDIVKHGDLYKWIVEWPGGSGERIPAYATRCVQDNATKLFSAQVWAPSKPYVWKHRRHVAIKNPFIYETHIGMSSEEPKVSTFNEFREHVLPRVVSLGYNTIQIMALQEHPYYGSFGYQVSNFFALSSRFGTPEEFKQLVDEAHKNGVAVIMDIVHSHAVRNELEGLSCLDGTYTTYFHGGPRGEHPAWNSRCFDYGKGHTLHFLLSNCKYWMEEYHLDGFRFDGVTSMLYYNHGLGIDFNGYDCYFNPGVDEDAVTYLGLANILIKELYPKSITIAEDMSGMAGLAAPIYAGGLGFDFRMSMGVPDHWIKWIKEKTDWEWSMGEIWYELTNKRDDEKTISYAECHDQALVGDKTIIFRLIDKEMYTSMAKSTASLVVDRGIALHKMIRLVTLATAGNGYLNFMGNEFGHPEWIDFPREGNDWSYFYARRQWSLADNGLLRYGALNSFDADMIHFFKENEILSAKPEYVNCNEDGKVLAFMRKGYLFVFNFNPEISYQNYLIDVPAGKWKTVLDSDDERYGGFSRIDRATEHFTIYGEDSKNRISLYLPSRTAQVLKIE